MSIITDFGRIWIRGIGAYSLLLFAFAFAMPEAIAEGFDIYNGEVLSNPTDYQRFSREACAKTRRIMERQCYVDGYEFICNALKVLKCPDDSKRDDERGPGEDARVCAGSEKHESKYKYRPNTENCKEIKSTIIKAFNRSLDALDLTIDIFSEIKESYKYSKNPKEEYQNFWKEDIVAISPCILLHPKNREVRKLPGLNRKNVWKEVVFPSKQYVAQYEQIRNGLIGKHKDFNIECHFGSDQECEGTSGFTKLIVLDALSIVLDPFNSDIHLCVDNVGRDKCPSVDQLDESTDVLSRIIIHEASHKFGIAPHDDDESGSIKNAHTLDSCLIFPSNL